MTAGSAPVLRMVAFGDHEPGAWGAAWSLGAESFVVLGAGANTLLSAASLEGEQPASAWTLRGDDVELTLSGDPERIVSTTSGFDQACSVSGRLRLGAQELGVECAGYRGVRASDGELERLDSIRAIAALSEAGEAIGLVSVRPRRAKGHGEDRVTAALLGPGESVAVDDPRLSTTYDADGLPARASLELWIGEREGEQQRLRRVGGEALGPSATGALGALRAAGRLFRWHSRGETAIGVYLLAS